MELYNDNCFNIFPTLKDKSVDLVLVDLPYGQTACKWDTCIDLAKMWIELKRVAKENTAFIFFTTTKFGYKLIQANESWFRYDLVWEKSNVAGFLSAKKMPLRTHEMIYVFYKKLPIYNPQKIFGYATKKKYIDKLGCELYNINRTNNANTDGSRFPTSIQKFMCVSHKSTVHPTQKPVDLCEWLIKTYSNDGATVLDFTMGSASTGEACKNTGRNFIGIEMDAEIYDIAYKRLTALPVN